jgi:hypothetical protein
MGTNIVISDLNCFVRISKKRNAINFVKRRFMIVERSATRSKAAAAGLLH